MTKRNWLLGITALAVLGVPACASSGKVVAVDRSPVVVSAEALLNAQSSVDKQNVEIAKTEKKLADTQRDADRARRDMEKAQRKLEKAEVLESRLVRELNERRAALVEQQERVRRIEAELAETAQLSDPVQ